MNLLNLLKYQLGSNLTGQLSNFLKEKPELVQSALDATLPSVLSVFVRKAADKTGANDIMDTIKLGNHDGSMLNYLTGLFSGGSSTNSLMSSGDVLANKFLGNKKSVLVDAIMNYSGIKKDAAASLVKMAMPLVLGVIGKQVKNQNMDVSGLSNLLSSQKGHIGAAIPSGFAIGNYSGRPSSITPPVKQTPVVKPKPRPILAKTKTTKTTTISNPKPTINETIAKQKANNTQKAAINTPPVSTVNDKSKPALLKFLPFILGGFIVLSLLIFGIKRCSSKKATADNPKKTTQPITANDKKAVADDTKKTTADADADADAKNSSTDNSSSSSSSGFNKPTSSNYNNRPITSSTPGEVKQELNGIVSRGSGSSMSLDGLHFSSNSVIHKGSRHILSELADVMNGNPNLRIKLESSKIGNAVSVKKGLMDAGINRNRIETTVGSGSKVQLSLL